MHLDQQQNRAVGEHVRNTRVSCHSTPKFILWYWWVPRSRKHDAFVHALLGALLLLLPAEATEESWDGFQTIERSMVMNARMTPQALEYHQRARDLYTSIGRDGFGCLAQHPDRDMLSTFLFRGYLHLERPAHAFFSQKVALQAIKQQPAGKQNFYDLVAFAQGRLLPPLLAEKLLTLAAKRHKRGKTRDRFLGVLLRALAHQDPELRCACLRNAAHQARMSQDQAQANYLYAYDYAQSNGVTASGLVTVYRELFHAAKHQDSPQAQLLLAQYYEVAQALFFYHYWVSRAACNGNAGAMYRMYGLLAAYSGGQQNAYRWLGRAAAVGHQQAQKTYTDLRTARHLYHGEDYQYRLAQLAEMHNAEALRTIAFVYLQQPSVLSAHKAAEALHRALCGQDVAAQKVYAVMKWHGIYCKKDRLLALMLRQELPEVQESAVWQSKKQAQRKLTQCFRNFSVASLF